MKTCNNSVLSRDCLIADSLEEIISAIRYFISIVFTGIMTRDSCI